MKAYSWIYFFPLPEYQIQLFGNVFMGTLLSFLGELGGKPNDIGPSLVRALSSLIVLIFSAGLQTAFVSEHALQSLAQHT